MEPDVFEADLARSNAAHLSFIDMDRAILTFFSSLPNYTSPA